MLQLQDRPRRFLHTDFKITDWDTLAPFGQLLLERDITTRDGFNQFLLDESEFESAIGEERTWRYIRSSTHTNDDLAQQAYEQFITTIDPPLSELSNQLNQKILASPFVDDPQNEAEKILFRGLKMKASLFRSENIPLETELEKLATESDQIRGAMTVELDGETLTLQQAGIRFFWPDRNKREEAWRALQARRMQDKDNFDTIFDQMVKKRHQVALNAGYKNFRDYMFAALQRFDYTPEDCFAFHDAIEKHVLPLLGKMNQIRAARMDLPVLKPWDTANDPFGRPALKAFDGVHDMVEKGIATLHAIDPFFGDIARAQQDMGRLDLDSRPNKRPGGYNAGMPESHVPFMFANVTSLVDDVSTFIHEAGHATHDILSHDLPLQTYRNYPMEIAEVASMSMELFAFDKWDLYFADSTECQRAQEESLASILTLLPWMAQIDAFQHAIYTQPDLTIEQRHDIWAAIAARFAIPGIDRSGFEQEYRTQWQRQGHVFSVPFYYIEYGIAQLGALQLWRNYMNDPKKTIEQYKAALTLGYTRTLPVLFATAGIKFDFSPAMVAELVPFLMGQLEKFES
jgi:oligoendopeptidase F